MRYPVFLINLERQTVRLNFMKTQLGALGIDPIRIAAVDGRDPEARSKSAAAYYAPMTSGEIGCFESHRKVWKRIVEEELEGAFILEDDVVVASDFGTLEFDSALIAGVDIIKIDETRPKNSNYGVVTSPVTKARHLVRMLGSEMSTGAYFVSHRGAKRLLQYSHNYILPVDTYMFDQHSKYFWKFEVWKLCAAAVVQIHMIIDQSELKGELKDRIQGAMRPELQRNVTARMKHLRLQLRRVMDGDIYAQRVARAMAQTKLFAETEGMRQTHVSFATADDAHYRKLLAVYKVDT